MANEALKQVWHAYSLDNSEYGTFTLTHQEAQSFTYYSAYATSLLGTYLYAVIPASIFNGYNPYGVLYNETTHTTKHSQYYPMTRVGDYYMGEIGYMDLAQYHFLRGSFVLDANVVDLGTIQGDQSDVFNAILAILTGSATGEPYCDIDIYYEQIGTAYKYTFLWSNLINPTSYYDSEIEFYIGVSDTINQDGLQYVKAPFTVDDCIGFYQDLYNTMANTQQEVANQNGYFYVGLLLCSYASGSLERYQRYTIQINIADGVPIDALTHTAGTLTLHYNEDPDTDDTYDDASGSLQEQAEGQRLSVDNLLNTSYVLTEAELKSFGDYIWSNDLESTIYGNQVSPIENILACKRIPFDVPGSDDEIKIGNVETGLTGLKSTSGHIQTIGSTTMPVYNNNWLAFEPGTVVCIYLPYIGIQKLQTNLLYKRSLDSNNVPTVVGRTITVKYYYDIVYGSCVASIYADGVMIASFNGECGIDIPITASNRASNELALIKQGANTTASTLGALASGNVFGALGGFVQGTLENVIDKKTAEVHFQTSGGISSQVASFLPQNVTLFIESPDYKEPKTYGKEFGYPCNLTRKLKNLTGYTVLDHNVKLSQVPCLDEEKEMLLEALTGGFYL